MTPLPKAASTPAATSTKKSRFGWLRKLGLKGGSSKSSKSAKETEKANWRKSGSHVLDAMFGRKRQSVVWDNSSTAPHATEAGDLAGVHFEEDALFSPRPTRSASMKRTQMQSSMPDMKVFLLDPCDF